MTLTKTLPISMLLLLTFGLVTLTSAQDYDVWIGTEGPNGIYHLRLNRESGALSEPNQVSDINGAGFLAINQTATMLYSTGRIDNKGCVVAFEIDSTLAQNKQLKQQVSKTIPKNHHPTHIGLDGDDAFLLTAQYGGGSITVFRLDGDGKIGSMTESIEHTGGSKAYKNRQNSPHPHWIGVDSSNSFVAVPDLGLDQVVRYALDKSSGRLSKLISWAVPPASGPRHMKFHSNGKWAYVLNEFTLSVSVFNISDLDSFEKTQEIKSLPKELRDNRLNAAAEVRIHPNGKFLYTSNRGHDSITVFAIDQESGQLSFLQRESIRGSWPRNFNISPCGKWLLAAGKFSNTLSLFAVQENGELEFTRTVKNAPRPICVLFSESR